MNTQLNRKGLGRGATAEGRATLAAKKTPLAKTALGESYQIQAIINTWCVGFHFR